MQDLEHSIHKLCDFAAQNNAKSIAFPGLGTGNLGWPPQVVAKSIYNAIVEFDRSHSNKNPLKDVHIVVYHRDIKTYKVVLEFLPTFKIK